MDYRPEDLTETDKICGGHFQLTVIHVIFFVLFYWTFCKFFTCWFLGCLVFPFKVFWRNLKNLPERTRFVYFRAGRIQVASVTCSHHIRLMKTRQNSLWLTKCMKIQLKKFYFKNYFKVTIQQIPKNRLDLMI